MLASVFLRYSVFRYDAYASFCFLGICRLHRAGVVDLAIVSAAIVAFIIYTMTMGKIREIAVLKLIGTRNITIANMILQQALGLGLIGFLVGKIAATLWAPVFPKYVLLLNQDAVTGLLITMAICVLASTLAIRIALKVDPGEAIG